MTTSGIATITNTENNKIFAFKSNNLEMQWKIYQDQLKLNIHHNINLQSDWNEFGRDKFEFNIVEEIEDDFLLDDEFIDYVSLLENSYNDFHISSFFFEYSSETTLLKLFNIMGRDECSSEFLEKLNNYDLSIDDYDELKNEMISLINFDFINEYEIEDKLNELIKEKSHQNRVYNLDMQYKLMNDLENIIGIAELKDDFVQKLKENNLVESVGFTIQDKIMEMIFSNNVIDNDIEKQIDSCIETLKDRISKETVIKLLKKADALENDGEYINKLQSSNLSNDISLKIINQLKELIKSGFVNEDNFKEKLDELIEVEIENQWFETKKELLTYLNDKTDSKEIIDKLNKYNTDVSSILIKINQSITNSIENREISSKEEIDLYIDDLIGNEILRITNLKEELLSYVNNTYGSEELTTQFKNKLNDVQLSIEDGKEFISQLSNEISLFKLNSINQINQFLEKLIFERNNILLLDLFNDLVGKEKNNNSFSQKLKSNYLTEEDGDKIRSDLLKLISDETTLKGKIDLRNSLKDRLDDMVQTKSELNYNRLIDLTNELINSLNEYIGDKQINDSFKNKLYSHNLGDEYGDIIKTELTQMIENEENGPNFELKMNQLSDLKNKGINVVVDETIETKASIRNEEYKLLKSNLISQMDGLIGSEKDSDYYVKLLNENNLSNQASLNIRNDLNRIIVSNELYDSDNFNYKYEELLFIEKVSVKLLLLELIQEQKDIYEKELKDIRLSLMNQVNDIIGVDSIKESFKNRLYSNQLSLDYAKTFKESMQNFICSDKVFSNQFNFKLDELIDLKEKGVEFKLNEFISIEYKIKFKELESLRKELTLELNKLTGDIKFNEKLKLNSLSSKIGIEIKDKINQLINSDEVFDSKFNYKLEELHYLNNKTIQLEIDELIHNYSLIFDEQLLKTRKTLHEYVNSIIGETSITKEFKKKLHDNYLHESFAGEIKTRMDKFIDSDEVFDKKYEFKFDELKELSFEDIESRINEIIENNRALKESELKVVRESLNKELVNLIGETDNEYYIGVLKEHNLNSKNGLQIRQKLDDLINSDEVVDSIYEFKLDELLALKQVGLKDYLNELIEIEGTKYDQNLKQIREKLLNSLNSIISKGSFKERLYSKQIDDSFIDIINKKLSNVIESDYPCDNSFEVKLDELCFIDKNGIDVKIDQLIKSEADNRQKELDELRTELLNELYSITGKDQISIVFNSKLVKNNLKREVGENIRKELFDLISSKNSQDPKFNFKLDELKYLKNYGVKNKVDDIVNREIEIYNKTLNEKRELLINLVEAVIGKNNITISFRRKLKSLDLDENFAYEIKKELIELINSDEVYNKKFKVKLDELTDLEENGIDIKINEIIDKKLNERILILKENLLKELYNVTGDIPLSDEFIAKLNNADFDKEMGIKIINHFKSEIDSLNIEEGFDFERGVDDRIYDESKNILLKQTYDLIGEKSNNEYFTNKLKDNMISTKMGEDIRLELLSLIDEADLKELTDLRKVTMQSKFDEIILRENLSRTKQLVELKEKLIKELNDYISTASFKNNLRNKNLSIDYIDKIKNQFIELINSDDVEGDFEFKVDELIELDEKGITNEIDEIVEKEADIINNKFVVLKDDLISDLKTYIWPLDSSKFGAIELNKKNLTESTGKRAYEELKVLISSKRIKNIKFKSKYDELVDLKNIGVKTKFIEIIDRYSKNQQDLIKFLHSKTFEDYSFNKKLRNMNLSDEFAENLVKNIEIKIKDNEYINQSQITQAISNYIIVESNEQEKALNELYDIVGKRGISLKFRARLMLRGLSSNNGKQISKVIEKKIKTEGLRKNSVAAEIEKQLKEFSENNGKPKQDYNRKPKQDYNSKPKFKPSISRTHVYCMSCGHKNINGSNFCENCGARLPKL